MVGENDSAQPKLIAHNLELIITIIVMILSFRTDRLGQIPDQTVSILFVISSTSFGLITLR